MFFIELAASLFGMVGSLFVISARPTDRVCGFLLWIIGNGFWVIWASSGLHWLFILQQVFFLVTNIIGYRNSKFEAEKSFHATEESDLSRVEHNGMALQHVKNQTDAICMAAVSENGYALEFVKNQTDEICIEAVRQKGRALQHVKNQTDEICIAAVRQRGWSLQFVKDPELKSRLKAGNFEPRRNYEMEDM